MCDATRASGKMFACLYIKFLQSLNIEGGPENCKKNQYTISTKPLKINKKNTYVFVGFKGINVKLQLLNSC